MAKKGAKSATQKGLEPSTSAAGKRHATIAPLGQSQLTKTLSEFKTINSAPKSRGWDRRLSEKREQAAFQISATFHFATRRHHISV
jgi:hypothetical protein